MTECENVLSYARLYVKKTQKILAIWSLASNLVLCNVLEVELLIFAMYQYINN